MCVYKKLREGKKEKKTDTTYNHMNIEIKKNADNCKEFFRKKFMKRII